MHVHDVGKGVGQPRKKILTFQTEAAVIQRAKKIVLKNHKYDAVKTLYL